MQELLAERYRLVQQIGEGGFGAVYRSRDEQLRRDVAIKLVSVKDRTGKKSARFRREAITMAKIEHPNVVTIYDVGELPKQHSLFLVMELLEGRNLYEEMTLMGALEPARALTRFAEALDGLDAAHAVGVVHKDLKPANLFLHHPGTPRERLKLIDFGIARMESLTKLTGTGRMAGSPRYLAPEYIMGEPVTPAIDVYQMALILVEALTEVPCIPSGLEFFDICQRHILNDLEIPQPIRDSPLGPIVERALSRLPAHRYQSAREFADALRTVSPESIPAVEPDETVKMEIPVFNENETLPDSEPTISDMVERLREKQKHFIRPDSNTSRYAGVYTRQEQPEDAPDVADHPDEPVAVAKPLEPDHGAHSGGRATRYAVAIVALLFFVTVLGVVFVGKPAPPDPIVPVVNSPYEPDEPDEPDEPHEPHEPGETAVAEDGGAGNVVVQDVGGEPDATAADIADAPDAALKPVRRERTPRPPKPRVPPKFKPVPMKWN